MTDTAWLDWRRQGIGASDVAAILGLSPWTSPYALWADKIGLLPGDNTESEMMIFGKRWEQIAGPWFTDETGLVVAGEQTWCTHRTESWARATVDGFVFDADTEPNVADALGVFEVKADFRHSPEEWAEQIPVHYQCQAQFQMFVTDLPRAWFAVLHNFGRFRVYELERNDDDIALLVDAARTFWFDHVLTGIPPDVDGSEQTAKAMAAMWPRHDPGLTVEADDNLRALLARHTALKDQAKAVADELGEVANRITAAIGTAETVTVDGQPAWTYKAQTRPNVDVKALCAAHDIDPTPYATTTEFRVLRQKGSK